MNVLYGFKKYSLPKKGVFSIETNKYYIKIGWINTTEESIIIGETDDCYIHKLINSEHGIWEGENVKIEKYILPIGYHKTRLVTWLNNQLSLF